MVVTEYMSTVKPGPPSPETTGRTDRAQLDLSKPEDVQTELG